MASLGRVVYALTDTLELHEIDLERFVSRTHNLIDLTGFKYVIGNLAILFSHVLLMSVLFVFNLILHL